MYMDFFSSPVFLSPQFPAKKGEGFCYCVQHEPGGTGVPPEAGTMPLSFQHAALPNTPDPPKDASSARKGLS